jgi:hypothetical protein
MRGSSRLAFAISCFVAGTPLLAAAQTQIKPRVLLMVDTSGSMLGHFTDDISTGGDGSTYYHDSLITRQFPADANLSMYVGNFLTGSCAAPPTVLTQYDGVNSRIYGAKAAVNNVINGSGDVDWGLMRYSGTDCAMVANGFTNDTSSVGNLNIPEPFGRCTQNSDCPNGCDTTSHRCKCTTGTIATDCPWNGSTNWTCTTSGGISTCRANNTTACGSFGRTTTGGFNECRCTGDAMCNNAVNGCITGTGNSGYCDCINGGNDACASNDGNTACQTSTHTRLCLCLSGTAPNVDGTCNCPGGNGQCGAPGETCSAGKCGTAATPFVPRGGSTCTTDNDCNTSEFCVGNVCGTNSNLCDTSTTIQFYDSDDNRGGACGAGNMPLTYTGSCGPGTSTGGSGNPCGTQQICYQDSDCGAGVGCIALSGSAAKACGCNGNGPNGTTTCSANYVCDSGVTDFCIYTNSCRANSGVILVDPATQASSAVFEYVNGREDFTPNGSGKITDNELRAAGNTPLAGAARSAATWYNNVSDAQKACRPYVLVQLTDGADTCEPSGDRDAGPIAAAAAFVASTVPSARVLNKVYVIGLDADAALQTELNSIAHAGGSGAARFANSQADIESALADIVASSVLVEKCNYVDDDCNGLVDEVYNDVAPTPTNNITNPSYLARSCNNGAVGHCAASGTFKCDSSQLSETCGAPSCRYGAGTSLTKSGNIMTLTGISGFASDFSGLNGSITIVAARNSANVGTFPIVNGSGAAGTIQWTNANGVAETLAGTEVGFEYNCALVETCRRGSGSGLTRSGTSVTLNGVSGFATTDIGDSVTINAASTPGNNGTFPITAVGPGGCTNNCTSVTFTNINGATEGGTPGYSIGCRDPMCRRAAGANFANANGTTVDLTGGSGFVATDLNQMITISAAANAANQGTFKITQVLSPTSVRLANPNGANEASSAVRWNLYCANAESLGGCNNFDDDCNGIPDDCTEGVAGSCCSSNGCQPVEVCNGIDDDCNGIIDDNPVDVGVPCNSDVGDCSAGTLKCCNPSGKCIGDPGFVPAPAPNGDAPACIGGNPPYPLTGDVCDGTDDNCDGVANAVPPQLCFTDPVTGPFSPALAGHGLCRAGSQDCTTTPINCSNPANCGPGWPAGKPSPNPNHTFTACSGAQGPRGENCDGFDNDCNDKIDDNPTDSWVGMDCCPSQSGNLADCANTGGSTHCATGKYECCNGAGCANQGGFVGDSSDHQQCVGGVAQSPEVCNGVDDNCDGKVDNVLGVGSTCTANGKLNAGACKSTLQCPTTFTPCTVETCATNQLGSCNASVECAANQACTTKITGQLFCEPLCDGVLCPNGLDCVQVGTPMPEVCNGLDDDCDAIVDEMDEVSMNDSRFKMDSNGDGVPDCMVAPPFDTCKLGTPECKGGMFECVGVLPSPNPNGCGQTDCNGNPINDCPPGSTCYMGNCDTPCADGEFPCPGGFICDRSVMPALCVPDQCAKLNCPAGQNCVLDSTTNKFVCVDPCAGRDCGTGKRCVNGSCVDDSCRTFGCPDGQICVGDPGMCQMDPCFGLECDSSQYCSNGMCVSLCPTCMKGEHCVDGVCQADPCSGVNCSAGKVCMVSNGVGMCVADVCAGTQCGQDQTCCGGACINDPCQKVKCPAGIACALDDACTASCSQAAAPPKDQIVGAGGGGFSCEVGGHGGNEGLWLMLLIFFLWRRSRREEGVL